jgi:hypothetical protein
MDSDHNHRAERQLTDETTIQHTITCEHQAIIATECFAYDSTRPAPRSRYSRIERLPQFMKSHEFLDPRLWVTDRPGLHKDLDWHLCMCISYVQIAERSVNLIFGSRSQTHVSAI